MRGARRALLVVVALLAKDTVRADVPGMKSRTAIGTVVMCEGYCLIRPG
jgi:hypothetical protein